MAYDKVVDSTVLENGLSSIADAIREKGDLGDPLASPLTFPSGFVSAIEGLSSGGATEPYIEETYDAYGHLTAAVMHGHTTVRKWCFFMSDLVSIQLPPTVTSIEEGAFNNCVSLKSIQLPDAITKIGKSAFALCAYLTTIQLPSSLITIGSKAFDFCGFTSLRLPAGLQTINASAFNQSYALTTVTFQGTPTSMESTAFDSCSKLTTINVPWAEGAVANAPWGATNATINYNYTPEG